MLYLPRTGTKSPPALADNTLIKLLIAIGIGVVAVLMFLSFPPLVKSDAYSSKEEPQPVQPSAEELLEIRVTNVTHAIYGAEGRCDFLHGESGEYGCYQYLPSTWRAYSTTVAGEVLPQSDENEVFVTKGMIRMWLTEGRSERWIFLMWNQGSGDGWGPGTKDCYSGVNKHGVPYDSCDYAARATAIFNALQHPTQSPSLSPS